MKTVALDRKGTSAILAASDGVWDAISFEAAAKVALRADNTAVAAKQIVRLAVKVRGLRDDTTCLMAVTDAIARAGPTPLSHLGQAESKETSASRKLSRMGRFVASRRWFSKLVHSATVLRPAPTKANVLDVSSKGGSKGASVYSPDIGRRNTMRFDVHLASDEPSVDSVMDILNSVPHDLDSGQFIMPFGSPSGNATP